MSKFQVNRFDGARHDANAREHGYVLLQRRSALSLRGVAGIVVVTLAAVVGAALRYSL